MLYIDIETRSRVDLKRFGAYRYAQCPDFKILMASWSLDGSPVQTALTEEEIWEIPGLWDPSVTKGAHNAPFERICFSAFAGLSPAAYLPPAEWHDTAVIAAENGYPRSLDKVARALGATPKDSAGNRLINLFCKPNRKGGWNGPDTHPEEWLEFIAYCEQDVETLMEVDALLEGWPTQHEWEVFLADQAVNDRGIAIDVELATRASQKATAATERQKEKVRELTLWEVDNPGSIPQMSGWLREQGLQVPNMKAETVERLLREDLEPHVKEVLELRQDLALAAPAKFTSALNMHVEGRLRGTLGFFVAHTGRWGGRGTQPQNLPRAAFKPDPEDQAILDAMTEMGAPKHRIEQMEAEFVDKVTEREIGKIKGPDPVSALTLKKAVRPLFTVDGCVVDYSAIEAVVLAWLSGEEWMLEAFRQGRDIYVETAARMGPAYTRSQGKIASLAFGYNGGAGSLQAMATDRDVITYTDDDGNEITTKLALVPDQVLYEMFVWPWRNASPNIVRLWAMLDNRFRSGGAVGDHLAFEKANGNRDRLLRLPSGRAIAYRKAGLQTKRKWNKHKEIWEDRQVLTFSSAARFPGRDETYGGRLAENATQAVARDLWAAALVRLEKAGLEVVAHVHDEAIIQGTKDVDLVREIMCELPPWAEGLPVSGEGFTTYRYKKG